MIRRHSLLTLGVVLLIAQPVLADIILPMRCHMGQCGEQKLLEKTLLKKGTNGTLYSVKTAGRSWKWGSEATRDFGNERISYVYCSKTKPAYIFKSESTYYAHLLNPGGGWSGYNHNDYPVYWATCHNFVGPNFFSEEMTARAVQLGYSLKLPQEQIELKNVVEIME